MQAVATVEYKGKPIYYSVLMARADAPFNTLEEAVVQSKKGPPLKLSLADVGSTSGWLIPTAEFKRLNLDPKTVFNYSEGASHAAQAVAVISGQADVAFDYDRNLDVLADTGRIDKNKIKIIWKSQPLPNDPIVVRGGFPEEMKTRLQRAPWTSPRTSRKNSCPRTTPASSPPTGPTTAPIEDAGKLVGKLK